LFAATAPSGLETAARLVLCDRTGRLHDGLRVNQWPWSPRHEIARRPERGPRASRAPLRRPAQTPSAMVRPGRPLSVPEPAQPSRGAADGHLRSVPIRARNPWPGSRSHWHETREHSRARLHLRAGLGGLPASRGNRRASVDGDASERGSVLSRRRSGMKTRLLRASAALQVLAYQMNGPWHSSGALSVAAEIAHIRIVTFHLPLQKRRGPITVRARPGSRPSQACRAGRWPQVRVLRRPGCVKAPIEGQASGRRQWSTCMIRIALQRLTNRPALRRAYGSPLVQLVSALR
jgi:hypothetical protein